MKIKTTFFAAVGFVAALSFTTTQTAAAQCRDPWINNAYKDVAGRSPVGEYEGGECNIKLYNNGSWSSYDELKGHVRELKDSGIKIGYAALSNGNTLMIVSGNGMTAIVMLNRSGSVIAAGGGNVVAAGGGNVVAAGGGNVVAAGGGNFAGQISQNTPGISFIKSGYSLQSGRSIKTSGKGGLKIQ